MRPAVRRVRPVGIPGVTLLVHRAQRRPVGREGMQDVQEQPRRGPPSSGPAPCICCARPGDRRSPSCPGPGPRPADRPSARRVAACVRRQHLLQRHLVVVEQAIGGRRLRVPAACRRDAGRRPTDCWSSTSANRRSIASPDRPSAIRPSPMTPSSVRPSPEAFPPVPCRRGKPPIPPDPCKTSPTCVGQRGLRPWLWTSRPVGAKIKKNHPSQRVG